MAAVRRHIRAVCQQAAAAVRPSGRQASAAYWAYSASVWYCAYSVSVCGPTVQCVRLAAVTEGRQTRRPTAYMVTHLAAAAFAASQRNVSCGPCTTQHRRM